MNEAEFQIISHASLLHDIVSDINESFVDTPLHDRLEEIGELEEMTSDLLRQLITTAAGAGVLKVAIIGDFSAGKSRFINSVIGKSVCPVRVDPTTSSISNISYGPKLAIRQDGKGPISVKQYEKRVCHPTDGGKKKSSNTLKFEIQYPYEVLRDLTLIDTPGFNNKENIADTELTKGAAGEADVIFFVMDTARGEIGKDVLDILDEVKKNQNGSTNGSGARWWYAILNQADRVTQSNREKIKQNVESKHNQMFDEVVCYSAKWAEETDMDSPGSWQTKLTNLIVEHAQVGGGLSLELTGKPGRKNAYYLSFDSEQHLVSPANADDVYSVARMREFIFELATKKADIIEKHIQKEKKKYKKRAMALIVELQQVLDDSRETSGDDDSEFRKESVGNTIYNIKQETSNIRVYLKSALRTALSERDLSSAESSFFFTPYAQIEFDSEAFRSRFVSSSFWGAVLAHLKKLIDAFGKSEHPNLADMAKAKNWRGLIQDTSEEVASVMKEHLYDTLHTRFDNQIVAKENRISIARDWDKENYENSKFTKVVNENIVNELRRALRADDRLRQKVEKGENLLSQQRCSNLEKKLDQLISLLSKLKVGK